MERNTKQQRYNKRNKEISKAEENKKDTTKQNKTK